MRIHALALALFVTLTSVRCLAQSADPPSLFVEGYAGAVSVEQGSEIALHLSTSASKIAIEITRLGAEPKVLWRKADVPGQLLAVPEDASANGCNWPGSLRVPVGKDWPTGYYEASLKVTDSGGKYTRRGKRAAESTLWFVVRPSQPGTTSKILLQLCTNTYNAYNNWGGFSLYGYHGTARNQGNRVSFNRPGSSQFTRWELPFVEWAEKNGIALEFAANSDLEFHPELLQHFNLVLSVGHDEYWSAPMRDHLEAFIGKGGNVALFSGNTCCWQVRSEEDGRALTCWKQNYHSDPQFKEADKSTLSTLWSHHLVKRPENQLTGVGFLWGGYMKSHGQFMDASAAYKVQRPDHWVFAGSGLKHGDEFGAKDTIVGYETDGCELEWRDGLPFPTHKDGTPDTFEVLSTSPASWHPDDAEWYDEWQKGRIGTACMGLYTRGGTVFTAATTDWAHGLKGNDPAVIQITKNIIERLSKK
jgi:hypothetical protein